MNPYPIINEILVKEKIPLSSWTLLQQPLTIGFYKDWLNQDLNGSMNYLKSHFEKKENPNQLARSAIVIAIPYVPHPFPLEPEKDKLKHLRIAAYSRGYDYHFWLKEKLNQIISELQVHFPNETFIPWTDAGPVLERDLAYRSGMGWFGKNTCLIHRKQGSMFLIGEIYTTLHLENQNPLSPDFCGNCTKCIDACPTQALESPRKLNATKCISYWTIESKEIPPIELRKSFQDWIFGCDICQLVCPWNQKDLLKESLKNNSNFVHHSKSDDISQNTIDELTWILKSSNKSLQKAFVSTPFARSAGNKLKRNAIIVIANLKLKQFEPIIHEYNKEPYFTELTNWCLNEFKSLK